MALEIGGLKAKYRTPLRGFYDSRYGTVESVRTVRVKEDRPWGAEQISDGSQLPEHIAW